MPEQSKKTKFSLYKSMPKFYFLKSLLDGKDLQHDLKRNTRENTSGYFKKTNHNFIELLEWCSKLTQKQQLLCAFIFSVISSTIFTLVYANVCDLTADKNTFIWFILIVVVISMALGFVNEEK